MRGGAGRVSGLKKDVPFTFLWSIVLDSMNSSLLG